MPCRLRRLFLAASDRRRNPAGAPRVAPAPGPIADDVLEGVEDALVVVGPDLRVVRWNSAMERLTALDVAHAAGRDVAEVAAALTPLDLRRHLRLALAGETTRIEETEHGADTASRWLAVRCVPLRDASGRVTGAAAFVSDVTERRRRAVFLRAIEAIGRSLTSSLDLDDVLDTIAGRALEVMTAEAALVISWDGQAPELRVVRSVGRLSREYAAGGLIPVGGGAISRAVLESRAVTTPNLLAEPTFWLSPERRAQIEREGYKAVAAAPLVSKGRVRGALVVHYWNERGFTDEEKDALVLLAEHAALAIDGAQLYAEATRRADRLRELAEVERLVTSSLELQDVLTRIAESTARLVGAPLAQVWTAEPSARVLRTSALSLAPGVPEAGIPTTLAFGEGVAGRVAESRAPIFVPDVARDPRVVATRWYVATGLTTLLVVPIVAGDSLLGVLTVSGQAGTLATEEDQALVASLAALAAAALQNARLYAQAVRRAGRLQDLAAVSQSITASLDMADVMQRIAQAAAAMTPGALASVHVFDADRGTLEFAATSGVELEGLPHEHPATAGLPGLVVERRLPVLIADPLNHPRTLAPQWWQQRPNASYYGVPIIVGETFVGVLDYILPAGLPEREEQEALQLLAAQAGVAVRNARLYREAHDTLQRLRETQAQLVQAGKLSALGQLVSGVAHELNNPLSVIIGYGQLLAARELPEHVRRPVDMIIKQGDRMAKIVRNLLYFARQRPPEHAPLDLHQIIEQTLALRLSQLMVSGIVVERDFAPNLPLITGDTHQLQQVFLNLLLNAEQAIAAARPGGGRIVFRTSLADGGRVVRAAVIDDGPGISDDVLPRVFEPFFTTKEAGAGTGLGLSVSYGIAVEHRGRLTVESQSGRTEFTLELPVRPPSPAVRAAGTLAPPPVGEGRLALVVEDEPSVLELVVMLLEETGWRVDTAGGGRAALEMIRHTRYALIVSDVRMPDGGGEELFRAAVGQDDTLAWRFIFITGDTANPAAWDFLQRVQAPVLEKPFLPGAFLDAVRRVASAAPAS